jgi:hypothetical protein
MSFSIRIKDQAGVLNSIESNYCAEKNGIRDLSLFENAKNFKAIKKFIEKY